MLPSFLRQPLLRFLRSTEPYLKTDMVYLASGGSWLALGHVISALGTLGLAVLFAHFVPKDTYGTYKYILSVIGILSIATLPGIGSYVAQAVARGAEGTFVEGMRTRMRWGTLGLLGGFLLSAYYFYNGNSTLGIAFAITALFVPLFDTLSLYNTYLQSKRLFKDSILYFIVVQAISVFSLALAIVLSGNLLVLLVAYFLPSIVARLYIHYRIRRRFPPNNISDPNAVRYGMHLSAVGLLGYAIVSLDTVVLFHFLGAVPVALYAFALAPIEQVRGLVGKNLGPLVLPKLSKHDFTETDRTLVSRLTLLLGLGAVIGVAYVVAAPFAFQLLFAPYMEAVFYSQLLVFLIVVGPAATYLAAALQSKLPIIPPSWQYWGTAIPDAGHLIALVIFVPGIGIYGVIVAKLVEVIAAFAVSLLQWKLLAARTVSDTQ